MVHEIREGAYVAAICRGVSPSIVVTCVLHPKFPTRNLTALKLFHLGSEKCTQTHKTTEKGNIPAPLYAMQ